MYVSVCVCIREYTFLLSIQINYTLGHKTCHETFQEISITKTLLSNQTGTKLEIIKNNNKSSHTWKFKNTLPSNI